ncbi:hypothetical protein ES703_93847 [subsurface metagenome]
MEVEIGEEDDQPDAQAHEDEESLKGRQFN